MSIAGAIIIYLLIWWCVFFTVLPQNVQSIWEDPGKDVPGVERGAPRDPQLKAKFLRTSWISALIWLPVALIVASGLINFRQ